MDNDKPRLDNAENTPVKEAGKTNYDDLVAKIKSDEIDATELGKRLDKDSIDVLIKAIGTPKISDDTKEVESKEPYLPKGASDEELIAFYHKHYEGLTRSQVPQRLYQRMRKRGLLENIPAKRDLKNSETPSQPVKEKRHYNVDRKYRSSDPIGLCYITTACVDVMGLKDNCDTMQTLRGFRDNWLMNIPDGRKMISDYYACAPGIVSAISAKSDGEKIFRELYQDDILPAAKLIKQGKFEEALNCYISMVYKAERLASKK